MIWIGFGIITVWIGFKMNQTLKIGFVQVLDKSKSNQTFQIDHINVIKFVILTWFFLDTDIFYLIF